LYSALLLDDDVLVGGYQVQVLVGDNVLVEDLLLDELW